MHENNSSTPKTTKQSKVGNKPNIIYDHAKLPFVNLIRLSKTQNRRRDRRKSISRLLRSQVTEEVSTEPELQIISENAAAKSVISQSDLTSVNDQSIVEVPTEIKSVKPQNETKNDILTKNV